MSWSFTIPGGPVAEFADRAKLAFSQVDLNTSEQRSRAEAALECATNLTSYCGQWLDAVQLSGHANPNHVTRPGVPAESL